MPPSSTDALHEWHDFYLMLGTASASLIGAMFIVASIRSGLPTPERAAASRAFLTPTVVHLSTVLLSCAVAMAPSMGRASLGIWFGFVGSAGVIYSSVVALQIRRRKLEASDRLWYGLIPVAAYVAVMAAALMIVLGFAVSLDLLAIALSIPVVASIRNAWDLILFVVAQAKSPD